MNISLEEIKEELEVLWNNYFISLIEQKLLTHQAFIRDISTYLNEYLASQNSSLTNIEQIDSILRFKNQVFTLLNTKYNDISLEPSNFDEEFEQYGTDVTNLCLSLPKHIPAIQRAERFRILKQDPIYIKLLKFFKISAFNLVNIPFFIGNVFRKEKNKHLIKYWTHKIPFRNLVRYYFFDQLVQNSSKYYKHVFEKISQISEQLHNTTKEIDLHLHLQCFDENPPVGEWDKYLHEFDIIQHKIEDLVAFLRRELLLQFNHTFDRFQKAYDKAGTIELWEGQFTDRILFYKHQKTNKIYQHTNQKWQNILFVLYEDWRFDQELFALRYKIAHIRATAIDSFGLKITKNILPQITKIKDFLVSHQEQLKILDFKHPQAIEQLKKEKKRIENSFSNKIVNDLKETVYKQNLPVIIDQVENNLKELLSNLSERRTLVKHNDFEKELSRKDIVSIVPYELVEFELLPDLLKSSQKIKSHIIHQLQETEQTLNEISQIAHFNIDSAIEITQEEKNDIEKLQQIIYKGIQRDIGKIDELVEHLNELNTFFEQQLITSTLTFSKEIIKLTENENIMQVRLRIAKAKALEESNRIKQKIWNFLKGIVPNFLRLSHKIKEAYQNLRERYGLVPIQLQNITIEIADFLSQTQQAIDKLPYVYQRLFRVEALENKALFLGRDQELNKLGKAYENWLDGRFAPTILVSEKGEGTTTLINFFIQRVKPHYRLIRISKVPHIHHPQQFIQFFRDNLPTTAAINTFDDLVHYFVKLPRKHIVIIENLEHLYLRTVEGFICLKMYLELLSKTNRNVFWVATCSTYTWSYLDKSLNIADFFGYIIPLRRLEIHEVKDIILKRHNMSGFDIRYEPSERDLKNKKFQKLPYEARQEYLEEEYFDHLGKFVQGNVSLAFLFWLRSTKKVINDTISIISLKELDFSFLEAITNDKIFALDALLLHGGLSEESMAKVARISLSESRLLLMLLLEDGMVVLKHDVYQINPLLYRQAINLLITKNIIH